MHEDVLLRALDVDEAVASPPAKPFHTARVIWFPGEGRLVHFHGEGGWRREAMTLLQIRPHRARTARQQGVYLTLCRHDMSVYLILFVCRAAVRLRRWLGTECEWWECAAARPKTLNI